MLTSNSFDPSSISTFVFDLDGVVYLGSNPIPHAAEAINALFARDKNVYFLTNNSASTRADYVNKLSQMGISVVPELIYTSAYATAVHLRDEGAAGSNAFVIGESGVQQEILDVGIAVYTEPGSVPTTAIDYVIVGIDRAFTYAKLAFAHECIVRGHAQFIATNRDSTYPSETGTVPGAGSVVIAVATASGVEPLTIGKPEPTALVDIAKAARTDVLATLMIGDRLDTDIACGRRAGTRTACVLTGVTSAESARSATGEQQPDLIISDLRGLL